MKNIDLLERLTKALEGHNLPHVVTNNIENSTFIIGFSGADESDCMLSLVVAEDKLEVQRIIGAGIIRQFFDYQDINDDFYQVLLDHYETIKDLIQMRNKLL